MRNACAQYGWLLGLGGFVLGAIALYLVLVGGSHAGVPVQDVGVKAEKVVPALGVEGYAATEEFCKDSATKVTPLIIPDAKAYQLTRTKDGKLESIAVTLNPAGEPEYAKYSADGVTPMPAQVSAGAKKCLQEKTK